MRLALIVFLFATTTAVAGTLAKDVNKALLDAQMKALAAGDAKAFASTFDPDAYLFLPTAAGEARGRAAIEKAAKTWVTTVGGKAAVKAQGVKLGGPYQTDGGFFYAELVVTSGAATTKVRITGAVALRSDLEESKRGEPVAADYKVQAALISLPAADAAVLAAAAAGMLPALPSNKLGADDAEAGPDNQPHNIAAFAKHVSSVNSAILVGSAPADVVFPRSKIAAKLKGWKGLKLATTWSLERVDTIGGMGGFHWVVAHVDGEFTVKKAKVKVPYRVLVIYEDPPAAAEAATQLLSAHFSVATQ